jgi:3-hydroxyisobutyrate dehydrogenase
VIVTVLRDADAVIGVMQGDDGALAAATPGATWAQMTTIGLEGTERCLALARERQLDFVDAPVVGTKQPAEQGELIVLASGPDQALERCRPLFDAVGKRTVHAGDADRATRLKLVINNWIATVVEGVAETLALAEALGLDPQLFLDTIAGGPLDSQYAQIKGRAMIKRDFPASFKLELALKDVRLVLEAAERTGVELPLARAVEDRFAKAIELGHGDEDLAAAYYASAKR